MVGYLKHAEDLESVKERSEQSSSHNWSQDGSPNTHPIHGALHVDFRGGSKQGRRREERSKDG